MNLVWILRSLLTWGYVLYLVQVKWTLNQFIVNITFQDQNSESVQKIAEPISDCILSSFRKYYERNKSYREGRFARLLLHTVPLRSFPADLLEELFFSGLVGNVKIESVIPYILGMETGGELKEDKISSWLLIMLFQIRMTKTQERMTERNLKLKLLKMRY